jgi:hypothetical protein
MANEIAAVSRNMLAEMAPEISDLVPDQALRERLVAGFNIMVRSNPDILQVDRESLKNEFLKSCADGLVCDNTEACILPYRGKANYQPMIYGIRKRLRELGAVHHIVSQLVYAGEKFSVDAADPFSVPVHEQNVFDEDRGDPIGGYAILFGADRKVMHRELFSRKDLNSFKSASERQAKKTTPAWSQWAEEMYRKSMIRRAAKNVVLDNDALRTMIERVDTLYDYTPEPEMRMDPFKGRTIEQPPIQADEATDEMQGEPAGGQESDEKISESVGMRPITADDLQSLSDFLFEHGESFNAMRDALSAWSMEVGVSRDDADQLVLSDLDRLIEIHKTHAKAGRSDEAKAAAITDLAGIGILGPEGGA